jgi:hypothetical protein
MIGGKKILCKYCRTLIRQYGTFFFSPGWQPPGESKIQESHQQMISLYMISAAPQGLVNLVNFPLRPGHRVTLRVITQHHSSSIEKKFFFLHQVLELHLF